MIALLNFVGVGCLFFAVIAYVDSNMSRWAVAGLAALGVGALVLSRALKVYFRYREAFAEARRGARKVAREHRKQGYTGFVPRSREAQLLRRLVPGASRREVEAFQRLFHAVEPHVPELATKRERLTRHEFGREDASAWERKLGEFMETIVLEAVDEADLDRAVPFVYAWYPDVRQDDARASRYGHWHRRMYCAPDGGLGRMINRMVADYMESAPYRMAAADVDVLDGESYELHCAHVLRECGWKAEVMGGSGDQGVDVIAERGRTRVAIQCKKYSRSVTNKAVQEVIGGRMMYKAHAAVVVSNASYTKGAVELARMTKVLLLHHTELLSLEARLAEMGVLKPEPAPETA